ncbi:MAG: hypothetical protein RR404_01085 [Bacilli bacterium]
MEEIDKLVSDNINKYSINEKNGILITNEEISILERYAIDYKKYSGMKELLFDIEMCLNNEYNEDLEYVVLNLSERDYYRNTNK